LCHVCSGTQYHGYVLGVTVIGDHAWCGKVGGALLARHLAIVLLILHCIDVVDKPRSFHHPALAGGWLVLVL